GGPVTITSPKKPLSKACLHASSTPPSRPQAKTRTAGERPFRLAFSSANPIMHTPSAENDGFLIQDPFGACHQGSHSLVARVDRDGRDKAHPLGQLGLEGRQAHQLAA